MIPGCVDSQNVQSDEFDDQLEPPFWLPEGALIHLDWVNQNFWWGSEEQVQTAGLGGNYDPTDASDLGLLMRLSPNMNGISLIGELLTIFNQMLFAGCTIVVDADAESGGVLTWVEGMFIWFMDTTDPNTVNNIVTFEPDTSPRSSDMSFPSGDGFFQYSELMNSFGINTFASTMNGPSGGLYRWGSSINGKTALFEDAADRVQDHQASFPRVDLFAIQEFDFGLQDCYVRRLTIYPPAVTTADLEALAQPYFIPMDVTAVFADVVLLCHFNGSDGATTTTDSSGSAHTVTLSGGAQLDTAQTAFGSASLLLPSTGSPLMSVPTDADFQFGTGPFVVEFNIRFDNEAMGTTLMLGLHQAAQASWNLEFNSVLGTDIDMAVIWSFDGSATEQWSIGVSDPSNFLQANTWYTIAIERDDQSVFRLFIDGVLKFARLLPTALHASTSDLRAEWFTSGSGTNCWIDDLRITKGDWWYRAVPADQSAEHPDS